MSDWKIDVTKPNPEDVTTGDLLVSYLTSYRAWRLLSKPSRAALLAGYQHGLVDAHVNTMAALERHGLMHPDCRLTAAGRALVRQNLPKNGESHGA